MLEGYLYPSTAEEASAMLAGNEGAVPYAGGTALALARDPSITHLVDLSRTGMDSIHNDDGGLHVRARVTLRTLARSGLARSYAGGVVSEAAGNVSNALVRNLVTTGGNVAALFPWSNLPPVLLAVDGSVVVLRDGADEIVCAADLYDGHPLAGLRGALITEVRFPAGWVAAYETIKPTATDYALVTAVVGIRRGSGGSREVRVVLSGCTSRPMRLTELEPGVPGDADPHTFVDGIDLPALRNDIRASGGHRTELARVALRRAITKVRELAGTQGGGE
jgi:aerobic carbon-monoxide dehydrogenase medium subunit